MKDLFDEQWWSDLLKKAGNDLFDTAAKSLIPNKKEEQDEQSSPG